MKEILKVVIAFSILSCIGYSVNAESIIKEEITISSIERRMNFERAILAGRIDLEIKNEEGRYPDYFGGMYITDDSKMVVLQVVQKLLPNAETEEYKKFQKILGLDGSLIIHYVNNSYNELMEENKKITQEIIKNKTDSISGNGIDIKNNKVLISINSNNKLKESQKILDFEKKESLYKIEIVNDSQTQTYIPAGGGISVSNGTCSMGFRTNYKNITGYVTAGHCVIKGQTIPSGTALLRQFSDDEKYDYAFIETKSSFIPMNELKYSNSGMNKLKVLKASVYTGVGLKIAKSGNKSGFTTGKIVATSYNVYYKNENKTILDLVRAEMHSEKGDSGAPIFMQDPNSNGEVTLIGILSGGDGTYVNFTSINSLPSQLILGRY